MEAKGTLMVALTASKNYILLFNSNVFLPTHWPQWPALLKSSSGHFSTSAPQQHRSCTSLSACSTALQRAEVYTLTSGNAPRKTRAKLNIGCALCPLSGKPWDRGFAMWVISDLRVSISIHNGTDKAIEKRGFYLLQSTQGPECEPTRPTEFGQNSRC